MKKEKNGSKPSKESPIKDKVEKEAKDPREQRMKEIDDFPLFNGHDKKMFRNIVIGVVIAAVAIILSIVLLG